MVIPVSPRAIASPCRKICRLDEEGFCEGCGRSLDDIRDWLRMDDPARLACVNRAKQRLAQRQTPMPAGRLDDEGRQKDPKDHAPPDDTSGAPTPA